MRPQLAAATMSVVVVLFGGRATAQEPTTANARPSIEAIDLGTLYPGVWTEPRAVNERATIVGTAQFPNGRTSVFQWTRRSGFIEIVQNGGARDINNRGDIVGYLNDSCGGYCRGFLWSERTGLHDLGDFVPYAINEKGDMAGECRQGNSFPQPCARIDGIVYQIGIEQLGSALDINNRGVVAASIYHPDEEGGLAPAAFTWSLSRGLRLLDQGDTSTTEAAAINNGGDIAGTAGFVSAAPERGIVQAARWHKQSLELLAGSSWTSASGLNDRGWIVGVVWEGGSNPGAARPLLWVPERFAIELPAPEGLEGYYAADVTNSGLIVGAAYNETGIHAVLWIVKHAQKP